MKKISVVLLFIVAVSALVAGYSFMIEPDGSGMKASVNMLRYSPFKDFFIPGLILFTVNGILNLFAAILLLLKWRRANTLLAIQGLFLTAWIFIQIILLRDFTVLHAIFGSIGLFLFFSGSFLRKNQTNE